MISHMETVRVLGRAGKHSSLPFRVNGSGQAHQFAPLAPCDLLPSAVFPRKLRVSALSSDFFHSLLDAWGAGNALTILSSHEISAALRELKPCLSMGRANNDEPHSTVGSGLLAVAGAPGRGVSREKHNFHASNSKLAAMCTGSCDGAGDVHESQTVSLEYGGRLTSRPV